MKRLLLVFALAGSILANTQVSAQTDHQMHLQSAATGINSVEQAFDVINNRMHAEMAAPLTGDPDRDFVRTMIPHHQGAVDMARVLLEDGQDPELRALAQDIIRNQEREIAILRAWQARNER